jgi:hypothetical protein
MFAHRWQTALRETGSLDDRPPVGDAVHRLLGREEQAILDLIEQWGGSTGPTASSRTAPPTHRHHVRLAVDAFAGRAQAQGRAAGRAVPSTTRTPVFPRILREKNPIWIWDATHFTRCRRVA